MKQLVTEGIVLTRLNYGEADRIITVLTPEQGKIRLLAKGVRKIKSKMAGGIELLSVNNLTYIVGKGDLGTLISSRLVTNFGQIVTNVDRTMYAYEVLKRVNKITEDSAEAEYFNLLAETLRAINQMDLELDYVRLWFNLQLLKLGGHSPNLQFDDQGQKLTLGQSYNFAFEDMTFSKFVTGPYNAGHIRLLRLGLGLLTPLDFRNLTGADKLLPSLVQLSSLMVKQHSNW